MRRLFIGAVFVAVAAGTLAAWAGTAPHGGLLLVVNQGDKTMSVVDPMALKEIAVVDEKQTTMHAHEVAAAPDHRTVYLPVYGSSGVGSPGLDGQEMLVVDLPTQTIKAHIDFGHGVRPHCVVYEPKRKLIYVTTELDDSVTVIEPKTGKIVGTVPTGQDQSHMLAITRDGKLGYTANVGPGTVSVLDLVERKTIKVIPVAKGVQRIVLSPDEKWVFTSDVATPRMAAIDTASGVVEKWIELPGRGYGSAATPDGKWLLVPIPEKDLVAVIDLKTLGVARAIPVVSSPQEMLVRPDGKFAYVAGSRAKKVAVIDLSTWTMSATIDVGNFPDGLAWMK